MFSSKAVVRASRTVRVNTPAARQNVRRYAEAARPQAERPGAPQLGGQTVSGGSSSSGSSHYVGGAIAGAAASLVVFGVIYQLSGMRTAARTMSQAKSYVDSATNQLKVQFQENTPEPNEAIRVLKETAQKYAAFVPGGRQFVDNAFKDIEIIRNKHAEEVDNIVKDAYSELREVSKNGLSFETASQSWDVLSKYIQKIASLAVDAGQDIFDNHPELKNKLGGSFDQLKQFGDNLGPEAKKQVEDTYKQIQDVINEGVNFGTVDRIRRLAQEKVQQLKKLRDQAWEQGYQQIQPMLEKNPQVKQLVEQNADVLKSGNVTEAFEKVKQAVSSGDTGSLNEYLQSAKNKADQFSSDSINKWLQSIPGGSMILPQLQKLREIAESHGPEAEKLAKETMGDLKQVLDKRSQQAEDLYKKAENETKK